VSFVKKYVPKQIQDVFNRIAAKNERELQSAIAEPRPDTFEVVIYNISRPPTRSQLGTETPDQPVVDTSDYYYYRARSLAGQHDHFAPPESATTEEEYERLRSVLYQGIVQRTADDLLPQTGDVYNATFLGANLVSLDEKVRTTSILTSFGQGSGARSSFSSGNNIARILANYKTDGSSGIALKFANSQARKDYNDATKSYYKSSIDKLLAELKPLGFLADSITINSTTRTATSQVNAMIGTRYAKGSDFFINWFTTNYKAAVQNALLPTIEANLQSESKLRTAMIAKVKDMKSNGILASTHMKSGAMDVKSNDLKYSDCVIVEQAMANLKTKGVITYGVWEGVANVKGFDGKQRRKAIGVFDSDEHFHITLVLSAVGE